ncbi:adhesion G-protein coupled receptor G5-like [Notolabrus celidotus]|uniref:adhesion G-protein coupled receptor G5-like n=1 Tax=Notolabrus celidotus TaxID=1203425 RepID=UPI00148F812B|nr:adhesion G-protein coupled receptor G5-like [Notolabrus celidotus]
MNWMTLVFFLGLLWISQGERKNFKKDLQKGNKYFVVVDNFNGVIKNENHLKHGENGCIIFLQKNTTGQRKWKNLWPEMKTRDGAFLLYVEKRHIKREVRLTVLQGEHCTQKLSDLKGSTCVFCQSTTGSCQIRCLELKDICDQAPFDENLCKETDPQVTDRYIINITGTKKNCFNCNNPIKNPEDELDPDELHHLGFKFESAGEDLDTAAAVNVMEKMGDLATFINTSSAVLNFGEGVTGILLRKTEPEDLEEVSFAYAPLNDNISIIENRDSLAQFPRSVVVTKQAFEQAITSNISVPFAAMVRIYDLAKDEKNSTLLGNEVVAVEMGVPICNLTDKIQLNFRNMEYEGIPSCRSWSGEGNRPDWTDDGSVTITNGTNITCQFSHLTFFAILLTPLNETTTSSDLKILSLITQIGCSLSIVFLSIILIMHCLLRKTKASTTTRILIHLVLSIFLLNFTFLINSYMARLKSSVGCVIMAAVMHYSMLASFTWFAVQAFHLCLQLYSGGKIVIRHYILKVCIISWVLPSVAGIVLIVKGKYGETIIYSDDPKENQVMCWMTDSNAHFIVNIGYYAVVFLFTFTTFVIILTWLFCNRGTNAGNIQTGRSIVTILGLCSMLGVTWGLAFFAYGPLLIPSYYAFTVLNSLQGFFLFIYYYNICRAKDLNTARNGSDNLSTSSTFNTEVSPENSYMNLPGRKYLR